MRKTIRVMLMIVIVVFLCAVAYVGGGSNIEEGNNIEEGAVMPILAIGAAAMLFGTVATWYLKNYC